MRRAIAFLAAAAAALVTAVSAVGAGPVELTPANAQFPFRSFVVSEATARRLDAGNVKVTENGQPVSNLSVQPASRATTGRFGTVLVLDTSKSMAGKPIAAAVDAARTFASRRPPTLALGVVTFNKDVRPKLGLTTRAAAIDAALAGTPKLAQGTHIYGAVARAVQMIQAAHISAGTIVLLSDGADTGSRFTAQEVVDLAKKAHVRVFTVGLRSGAFDPAPLAALANGTGGSSSTADSSGLQKVYSGLGERLANEYLVQYRSLETPDRDVTVKVQIAGGGGATATRYRTPALPNASARPFHASWQARVWSSGLAMVAFALLVAALIGVAMWALLRPAPRTVQRRVAEFVSLYTPAERAKRARTQPAQRPSVVDDSGQRSSFWRKFCENVEIADIALTPTQILVGTVAATVFAMFFCVAILGSTVFAIFGLFTPLLVYNSVGSRAARRRRIFGEQLPDTLQILASAVRAGHTLVGALAVVADEAPEPTRSEMRRVAADEQFGIPLAQALGRVATRMQNAELEQVAIVADLQRDAGGNIADVLEGVADTVRERIELRQLVRSLTAQGRLSRWLLTFLPPGLALIVQFIDPGYLDPLFHTASGQAVLILAGIMVVIGSLAIKRIVEIKV